MQTAVICSCDSVFHGVESTNSFVQERISEEISAKIVRGVEIIPRDESEEDGFRKT